jgi:hypothetical protein
MGEHFGREVVLFHGHVGDTQLSAGPEHPPAFGERACLARAQVEDAVGDDLVNAAVRQRDVLDIGVQRVDVLQARLRGGLGGAVEHGGQEVQSGDPAGRPGPPGGQDGVDAVAAAEVQDGVAGPDASVAERAGYAERAVDGDLGDLCEFLGGVRLACHRAGRAGPGQRKLARRIDGR